MKTFSINLRPICITCSAEMECSKNGVYVKLVKSRSFVAGDLYRCKSCKTGLVTGFAHKAFSCDEAPGIIVAEIDL